MGQGGKVRGLWDGIVGTVGGFVEEEMGLGRRCFDSNALKVGFGSVEWRWWNRSMSSS